MDKEFTIKENQALMLEKMVDVKQEIVEVKSQLKEMNGTIRDVILKQAVTDALAKQALLRANEANAAAIENPRENRRYIDKLFITALGSLLTAIIAIIVVIIEIVVR